jgi:ketosteroid isomerase-like protein
METAVVHSGRVNRWLVIAVVVLAAALVALGGWVIIDRYVGGNDDQALVDTMATVWTNNDVAAAKELYAADAVVMLPGDPALTGIDAISKVVSIYPVDPQRVGDTTLTYVPSSKDLELLLAKYKGARYVAYPVTVAHELFMAVMEIRDGKVAKQWVTSMYGENPTS